MTDEVFLHTAQYQHLCSMKVREMLRDRYRNQREFAEHLIRQKLVPVRPVSPGLRPEWKRHAERVDDWLLGRRIARVDDFALVRAALGWNWVPTAGQITMYETAHRAGPRRPPVVGRELVTARSVAPRTGGRVTDNSAPDPARHELFLKNVARVAAPLVEQSAVALRATGPVILAEDEPESVDVTIRPAWDWDGVAADGSAGWVTIRAMVALGDDWTTEVHDRGWALIGDHFVVEVTRWENASKQRPAAVVAVRMVQVQPEVFAYISSEASVAFDGENPTLTFVPYDLDIPWVSFEG